jgi:hypothetical protein
MLVILPVLIVNKSINVMKLSRMYLDTSVIGGCYDEEFAAWSNGLMKDFTKKNICRFYLN